MVNSAVEERIGENLIELVSKQGLAIGRRGRHRPLRVGRIARPGFEMRSRQLEPVFRVYNHPEHAMCPVVPDCSSGITELTRLMGIYNRDYLKEESDYDSHGPSFSRRGGRSIVVKIIIATAAVFVLQILTPRPNFDSLVQSWLSLDSSTVFRQGQIWRLLTYAFCHSQQDLLHIVFNMYILYIIGSVVNGLTGDREFLWFYLTAAVFSGICSVAFYTFVGHPFSIIGASGAVMAVFMLFAMHYPRQKLYLFGMIPIEVRWLLAMYIAFDAFPVIRMLAGAPQGANMVANSAHLGGLLFGFLYFRWNMRITRWWDNFAGRLPKLNRRGRNLKVFNPGTQPDADHLHASVDEILAKISREGESSLTSRERKILTQASRQLRKGRP